MSAKARNVVAINVKQNRVSALQQAVRPYLPVATAHLLAGIAVILVSLPLRSPHDALMNSGTIAIAVLVTAAIVSLAVFQLAKSSGWSRSLVIVSVVGFLASAFGAWIVQSTQDLERTISFVIPLAAIQFGLPVVVAPLLRIYSRVLPVLAIAGVIAVLTVGFSLAGQGDQESGRLELPARSN